MYRDTPSIIPCIVNRIARHDTALHKAFNWAGLGLLYIECIRPYICISTNYINKLQLPRLVVKDFYVLDMLSSKLDEFLMCRVLAHVVVPVLFALELDYEAVGEGSLEIFISFARQMQITNLRHGLRCCCFSHQKRT